MALTTIPVELLTLDDGVTISTADNDAQLILESTDADANIAPLMQFYRNSSSPADNDQTGRIEFNARNDNSQDVNYATVVTQIVDASDGAEDGRFAINTMVAGTSQSRIDIRASETVINNESIDVDFRVESDGNSNMLFVDAGNNLVGIGTSSNTHNSNTVQSFIVSGGSGGSSQPIVMMIDEDGSVEGSSCILELSFTDDDAFSAARYIQFRDQGGTQGTISGTGDNTVDYNTSSDERLKEDIQDTASKWDTLKALKVRDYKWKRSGNANTGFIAQELNEHWPNAVSEGGEDVAQDPWLVDYGKLTPLLTKALQEAIEKIETLEAKVKALEEA